MSYKRSRVPQLIALASILALLLSMAVKPANAPARPCADYIDVYSIQTSGASCALAHRVLAALYRKGFNAAPGSIQTVRIEGRGWRCRWSNGKYAPKGRCSRTTGSGSFTGLLRVG